MSALTFINHTIISIFSKVDFASPDFALHPKFKTAVKKSQTTKVAPGDALFIPEGW